ncbi:MAG: iron-sulfur cluster assembly protein [Euryarchaeota archaeon]|nr:iron-sulfur cluster assembly protein [Euryarchaeota archaeon]
MVEKEAVVKALKEIIDPHTGISVYDMGLIKDLEVKDGEVSLTFVPSSPFCPLGVQLSMQIKEKLEKVEGVTKVKVRVSGHVQEKELNEMLCK